VSIFIVSHKFYYFPECPGYASIQVGSSELQIGATSVRDNTGDNISHLNSSFCELTALYWVWKNNNDDKIGLVHYRRYFKASTQTIDLNGSQIASGDDLFKALKEHDIIVAKPRNYVIANIKDHYLKAHSKDDLDLLRKEISLQYPDYISSFDHVMSDSKLSLYNMFVAKRKVIEPYFEWVFSILLSLKDKIPYETYDPYQRRVFGFMAERLFNVWLYHHRNEIKIGYRKVVNIEGENLLLKGVGFLKRQYLGKR